MTGKRAEMKTVHSGEQLGAFLALTLAASDVELVKTYFADGCWRSTVEDKVIRGRIPLNFGAWTRLRREN